METTTSLFSEMTFAITMLHTPYDQYLKQTSPEMRTLNLLWSNYYYAKESYWNTPKEKRFAFFADHSGTI